MPSPYRLHYAPDNASLIVRLALEELGLSYETVLVDRAAGAQHAADYLKLNPNGLIPTLETPEGPIFETGAILLWLADIHGALAPAPDGPERAGFLKWLFFTSNTLHTAMRMLFYADKYIGPDTALQQALRRQTQANLKTHLAKLDNLAGQAPPFFNSIPVSALDLYIPCLMRWMALYPKGDTDWFDITRTPHLHALAARIEQRDSVKRAISTEGLGLTPFTAPQHANPPEGSAT
ncbi:glutathione S-transferase family protein [Alisedimentitalea sp. MJ-SS2]|uniref:glutathione S-transferase family protein n=1 Tax=Aliisedimentitalea sp. MJ-SS2 TaxID=3049795 RepID=UPI002911915D|nr:glutathione S-transferase family protein [Alisedimentitalea sp. MJ-SS2]MDU8927525.1 glutathione S-transferase family protein [Alisedimentitalea sp. MJ-SS2]